MRLEYFQLIDRVVALDLIAGTIRSEARVPQTSTIFEGHFPGLPLMPGVLLIEAMAQTAGWLVTAKHGFSRMPFLAAVKGAKLRRFVGPGDLLALEAKLVHDGSGFAVTGVKINVADKQVCDAEITLRVMPFPKPELRSHMEIMAKRLGLCVEAAANG
jgi:3-hydroxyacyl-[acyl-carrier-protein] dehydratase